MSFTLEYENDELVESMTLVAAKNGHREELKLTAQGGGIWTAEAYFDDGDMFVPDEFIVEYTFRADALAEAFSWSSASVPLLRVLEEAQDVGGDIPLTRYTLAEPALQEDDTGFGPGWMTQYHTYTHLVQEGKTQLLTVWSPEATRWFAGENGKLEEIGGYATARIGKGAATVTEADGGVLAFTAEGRLAQMKDSYGKTLTACSYDLKGRLKRETLGNGATVDYSYEGDRLAGIENRAADGTLLSFYRMGYDERGLLTRYETAEGVWLYEYDVMEQLTRTTAPDGTVTETVYDAAGNRIREITDGQATEYTVNALGQYTQIGETTLTYGGRFGITDEGDGFYCARA